MVTIHTTENFDDWFSGLKDKQAARRIQARFDRAEDGNFGDSEQVGGGVMRCAFMWGQATAFISPSAAWTS